MANSQMKTVSNTAMPFCPLRRISFLNQNKSKSFQPVFRNAFVTAIADLSQCDSF